jgi:hypothetical protein
VDKGGGYLFSSVYRSGGAVRRVNGAAVAAVVASAGGLRVLHGGLIKVCSATPGLTRPLSAAASLTEPRAAEFPPLRNGALGSLAVAVRPLESPGSC